MCVSGTNISAGISAESVQTAINNVFALTNSANPPQIPAMAPPAELLADDLATDDALECWNQFMIDHNLVSAPAELKDALRATFLSGYQARREID
ncbi:MAG: hypothetical protein CMH98_11145 [Oceanospirillaceae bacterium]|nr:hypothetical protein [Oceanospirillaceae bacterium]